MSDIREVYDMVTKQKPPEPGALERQQRRQVRTSRNRKAGVFALAAALGIVAIVLVLANRPESATTTPAASVTPNPADAAARDAAFRFLGAYGAFDARNAMMYAGPDADLSGLIDPRLSPDLEGLATDLSWYKASGYHETITSCDASTLGATTNVVCSFDFDGLRSDEIGRGPFSGSTYLLTVRDGEIVSVSVSLDISTFSPQMWEPFAKWVSKTYPEDAAVMYTDDTFTNYRLGERSNRLWEKNTERYVEHVLKTEGQ